MVRGSVAASTATGMNERALWRPATSGDKGTYLKQQLRVKVIEHKQYID